MKDERDVWLAAYLREIDRLEKLGYIDPAPVFSEQAAQAAAVAVAHFQKCFDDLRANSQTG